MERTGQPSRGDRPLLGHALDQLPVVVWTTDTELRFTSSEGGGLPSLGLRPGEVLGRTLFEYFQTLDATFPPIAEHVKALGGATGIYELEWAGHTFRSRVEPLRDDAGEIVGTTGLAIEVTDASKAREAVLVRDRILTAVSSAAQRLLGAPWQEVAPDMLAELGGATDVSRVYVFENGVAPDGSLVTRQRYEWAAAGVRAFLNDPLLQEVSFGGTGLQRWVDVLGSGGVVQGNVAELPAPEQEILRAQDIVSICVVPIEASGTWWGLLGFDECRRERVWTAAEVNELRAAAAVLGAAISAHDADEAAGVAEERYRTLVEQLPIVVYREAIDEDGTPLYVSPQYRRLLGLPHDAPLDDPALWIERLHPDDRDRVVELARWASSTGEPFSTEYRLVTPDGRLVWVRDEAQLLRDEHGNPSIRQGVLLDVTARKHAEEALTRRDAVLVAIGFAAGRFLRSADWRPALPEVLERLGTASRSSRVYVFENVRLDDGRLAASFRGEWCADGVPSIDTPSNLASPYDDGFTRWQTVLSAGLELHGLTRDFPDEERQQLETEGVRSQVVVPIFVGNEWWGYLGFDDCVSERVWPVAEVEALKAAADTLGAAIDRVRSEEERAVERAAAAELEARATAVLESAFEAIVTMDDLGRIVDFNPAAERMFGYRRSDVVGRTLAEVLVPPELRERHRAALATFVETRIPTILGRTLELEGLRGDGERLPIELTVALLEIPGRTLFTGFIRDLTERKRAEDEIRRSEEHLREAEQRYRALVEAAPAVVYTMGLEDDWPLLFVSPAARTVLGEAPEWWTATARSWRSFIHPDDLDAVDRETQRALASGGPFSIEYRVVRPDGSQIWIFDTAILIESERGEPRYWQGIFVELTHQKELELAREEADLRYRSVVEHVPVITYVEGPGGAGDPRFVSPQVEAILGYTPEEWLSGQEGWIEQVHPDDRAALMSVEEETQLTQEPFHAEYRVRAKDGRWVWIRDDAVPIRDERGQLLFWQGIQQDITERRRAEEQLRESEERYRRLAEQLPVVTYINGIGDHAIPVYISPQYERLTGYTAEERMADPRLWERLLHPDDRDRVLAEDARTVRTGEPFAAEYRLIHRDGHVVWVRDEAVLLRDEEGAPIHWQGVLMDVTERKLAEQALEESVRAEREVARQLRSIDEMKNTFLAAVSHELRSPLTSILGLAITLEQQELSPSDREDLLARLASNARKLDRLLKDLLDIDRLSRGIVTPKVRLDDVAGIVLRAVGSLDVVGERQIRLDAHPVVVPVDPAKIERIVENLVMNAVRHTDPGVAIWVRVWEQEGGALIAVEDDGPGVPPELRDAIFEPFRQGPTASPHSPGTGIGLSLVAMFAELHGGRAWVQEREGGGASFRVYLPGTAPGDGDGRRPGPVRSGVAGTHR